MWIDIFFGAQFIFKQPRGAGEAPFPDPAGGPSSFHTASRHASWPRQRRRLSLRSVFRKDLPLYPLRIAPGPGCFAFQPFLSVCQVPSVRSTTRLPHIITNDSAPTEVFAVLVAETPHQMTEGHAEYLSKDCLSFKSSCACSSRQFRTVTRRSSRLPGIKPRAPRPPRQFPFSSAFTSFLWPKTAPRRWPDGGKSH